jgi:hypothetical protein
VRRVELRIDRRRERVKKEREDDVVQNINKNFTRIRSALLLVSALSARILIFIKNEGLEANEKRLPI